MNSMQISFKSILGRYEIIVSSKFVIGFVIYILSFFVWLLILARKEISYIYPIVIGLSYFIVTASAFLFLQESLSFIKIVGIGLIGAGIIIIIITH
jgi:multidrug transporter EmrE-like cation transporter